MSYFLVLYIVLFFKEKAWETIVLYFSNNINENKKTIFFAHHPLEKKASVVVINKWNKLLLKALIQSFTLISISDIQFLEISR